MDKKQKAIGNIAMIIAKHIYYLPELAPHGINMHPFDKLSAEDKEFWINHYMTKKLAKEIVDTKPEIK